MGIIDLRIIAYILCGIGITKIIIQKIHQRIECKKNYKKRYRGCISKSCRIRSGCIYSKYYYIKNNIRKKAVK